MKTELASLELVYLVEELQQFCGGKVDRIYHSKDIPKELTIAIHKSGIGKQFLRIILPGYVFIDDTKELHEVPTGFCMMLRKYLEGIRVEAIAIKDFERVLTITFSTKVETEIKRYNLIIELFGKGNYIFTDETFSILNVLEVQHWKDRTLDRNEHYEYPKAPFNVLAASESEIIKKLESSDKQSLVKAIAIECNLGGIYAEELCVTAKVDKDQTIAKTSAKDIVAVSKAIKKLFGAKIHAYQSEKEVYPIRLETKPITQTFSTFNDAVKFQYGQHYVHASEKKQNERQSKIQKIIDDQETQLKDAHAQYEEFQKKGEYIYEHYQELDDIIKTLKHARKEHGWKSVKETLSKSPKYKKMIKEINEKTSDVLLHFDDKE